MNWSLIIGALIVITLVLFRLGQIGDWKWGALWTRFQKPAGVGASATTPATTGTCVTVTPKKPFPLMKVVGGVILIALFAHFYTGIGFLGLGGYSKTFEVEVATLEPHKLCGIPTGEHSFVVPKGREVEVFIGKEKTDITSALRVNKTFPGEKFQVEDGCVSISFAVNEAFQRNAFQRQIIAIQIN